ncbi:MAG: tetratricopeptide repeat protein [Marinilabiliaceae bacterium]|nr:tetratricopeptide repeat protein [Marinilabiliaceae bacterium]
MNSKRFTYILVFASLVISCSTTKNTRLSRGFHNLTAHYNVFYNGNESYEMGVKKVREVVKNDYSEVLPLFEFSDKLNVSSVSSDMDRAIEKGIKLIQKHSITKKPKKKGGDGSEAYQKFYNQKEFNKWVDDAYLLIAKAHFYKHDFNQVIITCDYIIRDFPNSNCSFEAKLLKASAFSEKGDFTNAKVSLESYDMGGNAPRSLFGRYMAVYADLLLKQQEYNESIPYLVKATQNTPDRWTRLRFNYILAQVYEQTGNYKDAVGTYNQVIKLRPPFEMAFNAKISQVAIVYEGANTDEIKKEIRRLIRDKKNLQFRDRLYYALANVYYEEGDETSALENLKLSTETSVDNSKQKALSFIKMGDIYFNRPEYRKAYESYDSAVAFIPQTDTQYDLISDKYKSLKDLVNNIEIVEREDSLQLVAKMSEPVRLAFLQKIIDDEVKRVAEEKKKQEEKLMIDDYFSPNITNLNETSGGKWYFYNLNSVGIGKSEFQRRWGKRALEDNWRRTDRSSTDNFDEIPLMEDIQNISEQKKFEKKEKEQIVSQSELSIQSLLANVPLTDSALIVSNNRIESGLINMGVIYRDNLGDYTKANEAFEELLRRFPKGNKREDAYIEAYQVYYFSNNEAGMENIKTRITQEFPNSKFTSFLNDPEYLQKQERKRIEQEKIYELTYVDYLNGLHASVINHSDSILKDITDDEDLAPKYRLIRSLSYAKMGDADQFRTSLEEIIDRHKNTEQAKLAELYIAELNAGRIPVKSSAYESILFKKQSDFTISNMVNGEKLPTALVDEPNKKHSLIVLINTDADMKRLVFNFADYNFGKFLLNDYDLITTKLPDGTNVLEVKGFNNKREALDYFYSVRQNPRLFKVKNSISPKLFSISENNYKYLLSSGDIKGCILFFIEKYLKVTPETQTNDTEINTYALSYVQPVVEELKNESSLDINKSETEKNGYADNKPPFYFVISYDASRVNNNRLKSVIIGVNRNNGIKPFPIVDIVDLSDDRKMVVVKQFETEDEAVFYLDIIKKSPFVLRDISNKKHELFVIGKLNFDQLIKDKSVNKYLEINQK